MTAVLSSGVLDSNCTRRSTGVQERTDLIEHLDKRPDAMWRTGTLWSFRNEAKVYGSPMLDAVWSELSPSAGNRNPLPDVVMEMRSVQVPARFQPAPSKPAGRGKITT
jgi:hypothetical protein